MYKPYKVLTRHIVGKEELSCPIPTRKMVAMHLQILYSLHSEMIVAIIAVPKAFPMVFQNV